MLERRISQSWIVRSVVLFGILLCGQAATAHPGVGIVRDTRGNVYYTDLKQVWRIAPDGKKSVAVPDVHTHELCVDAQDNLYGEHLWYEGERANKWGHYVWQRSPDGQVEKISGPHEGFLRDYSFVRDAAGNMYWAAPGASSESRTILRRRAPDGKITDVAQADFKNVRWMAAAPDGTVYLVDFRGEWEHRLVRITPDGRVATLVQRLAEARDSIFGVNDLHAVMGLAPDMEGNVYVAVAGNNAVKKVTPSGRVTVVARGSTLWYPTGVLPLPNGDLWVVEASRTNSVRARLLRLDGTSITF